MRTGSLTSGTGSPLWMSPEALQGRRVSVRDAWALDVYSYAIVLWEVCRPCLIGGVNFLTTVRLACDACCNYPIVLWDLPATLLSRPQ